MLTQSKNITREKGRQLLTPDTFCRIFLRRNELSKFVANNDLSAIVCETTAMNENKKALRKLAVLSKRVSFNLLLSICLV